LVCVEECGTIPACIFISKINQRWIVMLDKRHKQSDGINCGLIACLKVSELYGFLEGGSVNSIGESPWRVHTCCNGLL
jgi:hypothetical protein